MRQNCRSQCSRKFYFIFIFSYIFLQQSLGYETIEQVKRQGLIPLVRLGRNTVLTTADDNMPRANMIVYPRIGRRAWEFPHVPSKSQLDGQALESDALLSLDYIPPGLEAIFSDSERTVEDRQHNLHKRPNVKLIPRIGRK